MSKQETIALLSDEFAAQLYIASGIKHLTKLISKQQAFNDLVEKLESNPMFNLVVLDEVLRATSRPFEQQYANPRDLNFCACIWALVKAKSTFLEEVMGILVGTRNCFFLSTLQRKIQLAQSGDAKVLESFPALRYLAEARGSEAFRPTGILGAATTLPTSDSIEAREYSELDPAQGAVLVDSDKDWFLALKTRQRDVQSAA